MTGTLHFLSHSPFSDDRLDSCLHLLGAGDGLLLAGDAVYALQAGSAPLHALQALPDSVTIHALDEDLAARGLVAGPRIIPVDYVGFVALCERYARVNSWL